jgi:mRNA interferase YafQ
MKKIIKSVKFKKDYRRMIKRGVDKNKLIVILLILSQDEKLPDKNRNHKLMGDYAGFYECHIEPDWLLIYDIKDDEIGLVRTGTHSDLF